jgi:hypothetical protein
VDAIRATYAARLKRERPGGDAAATAYAGLAVVRGEAVAGSGYFVGEDFTGARRLPDRTVPVAGLDVAFRPLPWLSLSAAGGYSTAGLQLADAQAVAVWRRFRLWAGRRTVAFGPSSGGGIVFGNGFNATASGSERQFWFMDGAGVAVDGFDLPWFLRSLGPASIQAFAGPMSRNGRVEAPWVIGGRLSGKPFGLFHLAVTRGAILGGEGIPVTVGRLAGVFIGLHEGVGGEFENQVLSVDARIDRLGPLPFGAYAEWGMDDSSGAYHNVPGVIAGISAPMLPGLHNVSLDLERTTYAHSCCGNTVWYRNIFYRGAWAEDGRLLAHPLGGHGQEWRARARLDMPGRDVQFRLDGFYRRRGAENLYSPERSGPSQGLSGYVEHGVGGAWRVSASGSIEQGDDWREVHASVITHLTVF